TVELAERLEARGFAAAALNGDMQQAERERTVAQLKAGKIDILVATDVAARGLDVERISHVINFDVPHDTESYIHRIGRTGRAGRSGEAILFIAPREQGFPDIYRGVVEELAHETGAAMTEVAAALATLAQGKAPLLLSDRPERQESRAPEGRAN